MCHKAVGDCLAALKCVPFWLLQVKWLKYFLLIYTQMKIYSILMKTLVNVTFCCNEMGIVIVNLNNINHDDTNYEADNPDTIIFIRILDSKNSKWRINGNGVAS